MKKKMKKYFISYSHSKGFGHRIIKSKNIRDYQKLFKSFEKMIEDMWKLKKVVVLNFIELK